MSTFPIFQEAFQKLFTRWTLLSLAVEQGWGGRDSRGKGQQLQAEIYEYLETAVKKKKPPSHEDRGDVEELANFIFQRLDELFNAEADDQSDLEVAAVCIRLFNTCRAGDGSYALQCLQAWQAAPDLSQCKGEERVEYATEEDQLLDQMQGMDIEGGISEGSGEEDSEDDIGEGQASAPSPAFRGKGAGPPSGSGYPAASQAPCGGHLDWQQQQLQFLQMQQMQQQREPPPPPELDEDGFETVAKGRRRPR